jgi:two-component system, NarL family, sensor kinase
VVVGGFFALRSIAINEAERNTRDQALVLGRLVETGALRDGVLRRQPEALTRLDDRVLGQVLSTSVVRVKLWSADGTILYSDEPAIIGRRFGLGEDEQRLLRDGGAEAELSDLSQPENEYEREEGKLLEAHTAIRTPDGTQVLFEIYQRFGSVTASAERLLRALAPPLLGGLVVLLLSQVPLAWSMARRLQRGHRDRERLLASAV